MWAKLAWSSWLLELFRHNLVGNLYNIYIYIDFLRGDQYDIDRFLEEHPPSG